ncbi:hypothetical protein CLOP_g4498 [Closterium sp. NIES-67]|nr:hypothetical protein CLOP_g4498 [Closterium sp. NIES-67]
MDDISPSVGARDDSTFFDSTADCLPLEAPAQRNLVPSFAQDRDLSSFYDQLMQQNDPPPPPQVPSAAPQQQHQQQQFQQQQQQQQQQQRQLQPPPHDASASAAAMRGRGKHDSPQNVSAESLAAALLDPSSDVGSRIRCSGVGALTPSEQQLLLAALQKEAQGLPQGLPQGFPQGGGGTAVGSFPPFAHGPAGSPVEIARAGVRSSGTSPAASIGEYSGATGAGDLGAGDAARGGAHRKSASFSVGQRIAATSAAMGAEHSSLASGGGLRSRRGLPDLHQVKGSDMVALSGGSGMPRVTRPSPTGKRDSEGNLVVSTPGRYTIVGASPRGPLQVAEAQGLGASPLGGGNGGSGDSAHLSISPEAVLAAELSKIGVSPAVIAAATGAAGQLGSGMADASVQWGRGNQNPKARGSMGPPGGSGSVSSGRSQAAGGGQQHSAGGGQQLQKQGSGSEYSMDAHTEGAFALGASGSGDGNGGGGGGGSRGDANTQSHAAGYSTKPRSVAERMRREKITSRLQNLKEVLPKMDAKTDTSAMLEDAVVYIQSLQARCKALERQNGALSQQLREIGVTPAVISNPSFNHQ